MIRLIAILLCCSLAHGATYYVATTGSDSRSAAEAQNAGTPWLTIQKAANTVAAGDTVNVAAGTYAEFVTIAASGTALNRITFNGTRGGGGEWQTIIDPSVELSSSGWVDAGSGIWKKTGLSFVPGHVTVNGQHLYNINTNMVSTGIAWPAISAASDLLITRTDLTWNTPSPYWDGAEGFWLYATNYLFIRFRDNVSPATKTIRVSNANSQYMAASSSPGIGVLIRGSYVTVQNFHVRGSLNGIGLRSASTYTRVLSNYVQHGYASISAVPNAIHAINNCDIAYNLISQDHYNATGTSINGAWSNIRLETWAQLNRYYVSKNYEGNDDGNWGEGTEGGGVDLTSTGNNMRVVGNTITNSSFGGIWQGNNNDPQNYPPTTGFVIASNLVLNCSGSGFSIHNGAGEVRGFENTFSNISYAWRVQNLDLVNQGGQDWYIYRNRQVNPQGLGVHIYPHFNDAVNASVVNVWVYNNSWAGGRWAVNYDSNAYPTNGWPLVKIQALRFFNNIVSADLPWTDNGASYSFGVWSHNLVYNKPAGQNPSWFLASNINQGAGFEWESPAPIGLEISTNSLAWENGTNISGLTGFDSQTLKYNAWDIGAEEYTNTVDEVTTPPVSLSTPTGTTLMEQGAGTQTVTLTRSGSTTGDLAVNISIGGTATPAQHFIALSDVWTLAAGSSSTNITVTAIDDGIYSGGLTITFTIDPAAGYTVAGTPITLNRIDAQVNPELTTGRDPSGQSFTPGRLR